MKTLLLGLIGYTLSFWAIQMLTLRMLPDYVNLNDSALSELAAENLPLLLLGTAVLTPVTEEILYRGLVFGLLYERSPRYAYLLSALIFAGIHVAGYLPALTPISTLLSLLGYLPAGLWLPWSYRRSGTVFVPIFLHSIINFTVLTLLL